MERCDSGNFSVYESDTGKSDSPIDLPSGLLVLFVGCFLMSRFLRIP